MNLTLKCPTCLVGGCDDARSDAELVFTVRIELDLILEGQDGTAEFTRRDISRIKAWLRKHG